MRQVYARTVGVLAAEDGVRPGYYRIRFRLPFVHAAERRRRFGLPHGGIPFRRIGRVTRNLLSRQNVLLQPRWLLLLRTATSFARPVLRFLPPSLSFSFFSEAICIFQWEWICLRNGLKRSKDWYFWNIYIYLKYIVTRLFFNYFWSTRDLYILCVFFFDNSKGK